MQVYKALLNDVTEVAAKQLKASSEAQTSLFRREILIHKCCRSVRPYCRFPFVRLLAAFPKYAAVVYTRSFNAV